MMKRATTCLIALLAVVCTVLTGCDGGYDCSIENTAYNKIGFYNINAAGVESAYAFPETMTVSLLVNGKDSIVVNHITGTDGLKLPMSYAHTCDTVVFLYENNTTDTLYVKHENIPFFVSMECGTAMYHRLLEVAHTNAFIDSVAITDDYVNFDYDENIKLYLVE